MKNILLILIVILVFTTRNEATVNNVIKLEKETVTVLPRYRIEGYTFVAFKRVDQLPFVEIRPMNHYVDIEYLEGTDTFTWFRIDDYLKDKAGIVNSVQYNGEMYCYLWWWQDEYGEDGNPHPSYESWVDCSIINEISWR